MHNYHDTFLVFPPGVITYSANTCTTMSNGQSAADLQARLWGWGTFVLPYIDQAPLYNQLNPDGCRMPNEGTLYPLTGGVALLQTPMPAFRCPSDGGNAINPYGNNYSTSNYVISQDLANPNTRIGIRDIEDGTSHTFMHGERRLKTDPLGQRWPGAIVWGRGTPSDHAFKFRPHPEINMKPTPFTATNNPGSGDPMCARHGISSAHAGGAQFLMCDGAVRFIGENIAYNPNVYASTGACVDANPNQAGMGFTYQNLFFRSDSNAIGDF